MTIEPEWTKGRCLAKAFHPFVIPSTLVGVNFICKLSLTHEFRSKKKKKGKKKGKKKERKKKYLNMTSLLLRCVWLGVMKMKELDSFSCLDFKTW